MRYIFWNIIQASLGSLCLPSLAAKAWNFYHTYIYFSFLSLRFPLSLIYMFIDSADIPLCGPAFNLFTGSFVYLCHGETCCSSLTSLIHVYWESTQTFHLWYHLGALSLLLKMIPRIPLTSLIIYPETRGNSSGCDSIFIYIYCIINRGIERQ